MYDQRLKNSKQGNWIIWTISSVAFDNDELLVEDSFDDKLAPIMLQSSLTKHLLKADILFRREFEIIPVDSGICRCRASDPLFRGCHQSGSLSGVTRERHPTSQSEHLLYAEKFFGIQRYSSLPSGDGKNPRRRISDRSSENPPLRLPGGSVPGAILQPFRDRLSRPEKGLQWLIIKDKHFGSKNIVLI